MKRVRNRVKQRLARLKRFPKTGRPTEEPAICELIIAGTPYIAVYEIDGDVITIVAFFHVSQDR